MNDDDQLVDMYLTRNALRQQTLGGDMEHSEDGEPRTAGARMSTIMSQANLEAVDSETQDAAQRLKSLEEQPFSPSRCVQRG